MYKFPEAYSFPRLIQERTDHLSRQITRSEIESVTTTTTTIITTKKHSANKSPGLDVFIRKYYQIYKEELIPILLKVFQNIEEEGTFLNS